MIQVDSLEDDIEYLISYTYLLNDKIIYWDDVIVNKTKIMYMLLDEHGMNYVITKCEVFVYDD